MTSNHFPEEINTALATGDHKTSIFKTLNREFKARDRAHNRWKDKLTKEVEGRGHPDLDTGYLYVEAGETYDFKHKLRGVPSRWCCFFSEVEFPRFDRDEIYAIPPIMISTASDDVGFTLSFPKKDWAKITIGDVIFGAETTGYLRIQLWR